jgi:hypothetical protein
MKNLTKKLTKTMRNFMIKQIEIHDDWETPNELYDKLDAEFHFDFDPCPLKPTFDGLNVEWGKSNFVNPPYSDKKRSGYLKSSFVKKSLEESNKGKLCVLLLPVSTSTKLFHDVILPHGEIRFLRGRPKVKGINTKGEYVTNVAGQKDCMIVIFRGKKV